MYPNWLAPLLSLPAGLALAWSFERERALLPVALEHALYGALLFTIGLGPWFGVPVP